MKHLLSLLLLVAMFKLNTHAQTFVTSAEAESGVLTGVQIAPQTGSSSGPYVTGFDATGDKVVVTVTVPSTANYKLEIGYRSLFGAKTQDIFANNIYVAGVVFPQTTDFVNINAGTVFLNAGANTISMVKNWGYMDVDKFSIYTMPPNVFNIATSLIDPLANTTTRNLYNFLTTRFGKRIITGQTDGYYDSLQHLTGKSPLLRAWDMASYSPMYAYNWVNGAHAFGAVDNHDAEKAIAWYNSTGKKGIVSFHWHWHSPSGGTPGTNTFYTQYTSFDVSQAVISGTQQNTDVLRDIDAIAVQLKKLRDADVPVLWRPLHEAGGRWFWWGAKSSAEAKSLWDIMYNRLTNFHGIHNLIWIWSTPEALWYPGNAKVDMIGYDSYPGVYNYTTQKNVFDNLYTITGGQKLIAMSENGPIPDIQNAFSADAKWSYFMSWNDLVFAQNTTQHIQDVFADPKVITLENYASPLPVVLTSFTVKAEGAKVRIEWVTATEQANDRFVIERSSDGRNFYSLTTVNGAGNSSVEQHYLSFDNSPLKGLNHYRLVQYNTDGRRTTYGIKTVNFNSSFLASIMAYPNPAAGSLGFLLSNFEGKMVTVTVADMQGKTVHRQLITTTNGQAYYTLDIAAPLAKGQYIMNITGEGLEQNVKVTIEK